jgi:2-keto-4-pentenoate hydratase
MAARRGTAAACGHAADWLREAVETGNPLAPLPPEFAPGRVAEGERIAALVLERIGLAACGVRLAPGPEVRPVAGPVLEGRLLPAGATLALAALRHASATAAIVAVLAEDLPRARRGGPAGLPALAAVHPALDVAASRFRDPPRRAALLAADLAGLGQVVVGRRAAAAALSDDDGRRVPVALSAPNRRPRGEPRDLHAALEAAAAAARRLGGLPAGALLVVAGLSPAVAPEAGLALAAGLGPLGRVKASFG